MADIKHEGEDAEDARRNCFVGSIARTKSADNQALGTRINLGSTTDRDRQLLGPDPGCGTVRKVRASSTSSGRSGQVMDRTDRLRFRWRKMSVEAESLTSPAEGVVADSIA